MSMWIYIEDEKKNLEQQNKITKSSLFIDKWSESLSIELEWIDDDDDDYLMIRNDVACVCVWHFSWIINKWPFFYMNKNVLI